MTDKPEQQAARTIPISEVKGHLSALAEESKTRDIILFKHSRPHAVLIGYERYKAMLGLDD